MRLHVVLGNQLFSTSHLRKQGLDPSNTIVFMREDRELCTYYRFHKQKIVFFLSAMRTYAAELREAGFTVHYQTLGSSEEAYEEALGRWVRSKSISKFSIFEVEDKFFEERILAALRSFGSPVEVLPSPMFLNRRHIFSAYLEKSRRPFMKTFYEDQRRRMKILMEGSQPVGGRWSFDEDNRRPLPKDVHPPGLPAVEPTETVESVIEICEAEFSDHPGSAGDFWLPVDRAGARSWLRTFIDERLASFGPYEDAIPARSEAVFHSVLTPFLNVGLLDPEEVVREVLARAQEANVPLASLEGFVRQVIGWREFIRGIYREFSAQQDVLNHWGHTKKLSGVWYRGKTGVPPLDRALDRVWRRGYLHHIERLMIIGNLMVLLEVDPREAHRWFMEMFIDSSDWVMGPNVYGMALFSDGGIFATKPYICGSNYYRKMSGDKEGEWCAGVDGLYWEFIERHKAQFSRHPRMSMMVRSLEKITPQRRASMSAAADELRRKLVTA